MQQKKTMDGELKHERPPINFSFLFYRSDLFQILGRKTQTSTNPRVSNSPVINSKNDATGIDLNAIKFSIIFSFKTSELDLRNRADPVSNDGRRAVTLALRVRQGRRGFLTSESISRKYDNDKTKQKVKKSNDGTDNDPRDVSWKSLFTPDDLPPKTRRLLDSPISYELYYYY